MQYIRTLSILLYTLNQECITYSTEIVCSHLEELQEFHRNGKMGKSYRILGNSIHEKGV